jgi:hypothetical protein
MVTRSVTSESGFLVIDASYVGALARPGSRGFYLTEGKGPIGGGFSLLGQFITTTLQFEISSFAPKVYFYRYFSKEITVEYVEIGNKTAAAIPEFTFFDLFVLVEIINVYNGASKLDQPAQMFNETYSSLPFNRTQEPASFLTPTVKIAKIRYSL